MGGGSGRVKTNPSLWRWFFILAALEAGAAFVALVAIPHESGGYSTTRLAMLGILAACTVAATAAALLLARRMSGRVRPWHALASFVIAVLVAVVLFLLRYLSPERLLQYYERLSPLLWYFLLLFVEFSAVCLAQLYGFDAGAAWRGFRAWRAAAIAFGILVAALMFVGVTRIGITPDPAYVGEPGVPVLGWQLALAVLCGGGAVLAGLRWKAPRRIDWAIAVAIWLLAVLIWMSVPVGVLKNSFYAPITPPANQPYPNSDAAYYDSMSQSLLIGYPYLGDIPTRPLYITFLAILHALVGQRYDLVIFGQTQLLACIPVVLYFLGKRLHSRAAGIVAALFAIFREWNALLVSSQTRVSNTKMLLVDLPTLLLMLLACLFVMRWLQRRGRMDAIVAGGALGVLLLLRTQSLVIVPIVIVLAIIAMGIRNRALGIALLLFVVGFLAAVVPWLAHNYVYTHQITLDAPFEYQVIASQYQYTGNLDLNAVDLQGKSLAGILLTFALKDPGFVAWFIATHFFATMLGSVAALPLAARYDGLLAPLNLYWMDWIANLNAVNMVLLVLYLAIIAMGIAAAWRRLRWSGLVPLVFGAGYALANGIGRFSGWRYDLPADWIAYFYFAVGAAEVILAVARAFCAQIKEAPSETSAGRRRFSQGLQAGLLLAAFAVVGALPWFAEGFAAPRYADQTLRTLMNRLVASPGVQALHVTPTQIQDFAANPQAELEIGRVLYPRFFTRGDGIAGTHPWPAFAVRDFPRMGFVLLNESRHDVVVPLKQAGAGFVQGTDAIILGCQRADYIEVRLILFPDLDVAYLTAPLTKSCQ